MKKSIGNSSRTNFQIGGNQFHVHNPVYYGTDASNKEEHASYGDEESSNKTSLQKEKHKRKTVAVVVCVLILVVVILSLTLACLKANPDGFTFLWATIYYIIAQIP